MPDRAAGPFAVPAWHSSPAATCHDPAATTIDQPNRACPQQFDEVIATGMAKDPDQRYATTVELAHAAQDAITTPMPRPAPAVRATAARAATPVPVDPPTVADDVSGPRAVSAFAKAPTQHRPPHESRPGEQSPIGHTATGIEHSDRGGVADPWARSHRAVLSIIAVIVGVTLAVAGNQRERPWLGETALPFTGLGHPRRVWRWTPRATSTSPLRLGGQAGLRGEVSSSWTLHCRRRGPRCGPYCFVDLGRELVVTMSPENKYPGATPPPVHARRRGDRGIRQRDGI